jgi:hypothetical protein
MSRRGVQLLLVAVLGLVLWTFAGADVGRSASAAAAGGGESAESTAGAPSAELVAPMGGWGLGGQSAVLSRAPSHRTPVARAQRLATLVIVLVGGGPALRPRRPGRTRVHDAPVWSGWFADPGRLRGPPAI